MKDGIIIQARTGSTRLHNKILLPFYGEQHIIDILIANIKAACPGKEVVLATTSRSQDDVLEEVARMALLTRQLDPAAAPAPQYVQDKHYLRKHGPNAYYGQHRAE